MPEQEKGEKCTFTCYKQNYVGLLKGPLAVLRRVKEMRVKMIKIGKIREKGTGDVGGGD